MGNFKIKKRSKGPDGALNVNVSPLIDMMSTLLSFLLMVAVFSATGYHRIEVPFLSSAPPPKQEELEKKPAFDVVVTIDKEDDAEFGYVLLNIGYKHTSLDSEEKKFELTEIGLNEFQEEVYKLRKKSIDDPNYEHLDLVTVMTEEHVEFQDLASVLDYLRILKAEREPLMMKDYIPPLGVDPNDLIPKIVLGNATMIR